ncbi:MAG: peptidyl-prolyl cis-trans isomerase [Lachnospiraceae bacterium]|nr:peptidyl-prolyl cis-trans isomerase [Lachnospiraceae bacterium]
MNSAKKIMKNQGLGERTPGKKNQPAVSQKNKVLLIIGILLILVLGAGICYIQLRPREILTVEGLDSSQSAVTNVLYYTDAMYDIYTTESQYNNGIYEQIYGGSFWTAENVDSAGRNGASAAKKQIMDTLKQREILYMEALKAGLSLTDEETKQIQENAASARENLTDSQKRIAGLDEATIYTVLEKQALADKYKSQVIAGLNIDEEALKKTVSKKDYRQYTLQYYTWSKTETDTDNNTKNKDSALIEKAKGDMEALQKKAAAAEDFSKDIITDSDNDNTDDATGIRYTTLDLLETDTDSLDASTRKKVKAMKNGEVSDVIETDDAFYVFKMVNNNDTEAYDTQCNQIISEEQESQFDTAYKNTIKPNYTTEVQSYWRQRVTIGYLTSDTDN